MSWCSLHSCLYWIMYLIFRNPVYCRDAREVGFFGQNCKRSHCDDEMRISGGHCFCSLSSKCRTDIHCTCCHASPGPQFELHFPYSSLFLSKKAHILMDVLGCDLLMYVNNNIRVTKFNQLLHTFVYGSSNGIICRRVVT